MSDLSFAVLTDELRNELVFKGDVYSDDLAMMLDSFLELSREGIEAAVAIKCGCLLVRIFADGEYSFVSPIELEDGASVADALILVRDYAMRQMLPLIFTDVPRADIEYYQNFFKMPEARVYPDEDDTFFVSVFSECDGVDKPPSLYTERLILGEISEEHVPSYARLCRDKDVNRYWGYDVSADNKEDTDEFFLEVASRELDISQAITLGIFFDGALIGEAVIYAFDFTGGASFGIRLLPEYHGKGFGTEALGAVISYSRDIGLDYLCADVMPENTKSIKMMDKYFDTGREKCGKMHFKLKLN